MVTREVVLAAASGLHARPAGELVKLVKGFAGTVVKIGSGEKAVNAGSMLSVLSLGLKSGSLVKVFAEGPAEQEALEAVCGFIESISE